VTARLALARCLAQIDAHLTSIVVAPSQHGTTSEVVLFVALALLEARVALTGGPDPQEVYRALCAEHRIPSAHHACQHFGIATIAPFLSALVSRAAPDCSGQEGTRTRADVPDATPAPSGAQGALPGMEAPLRVRRTAMHRFGLLRWETAAATPLVPEHLRSLETCRHCSCQRRRANTGVRMGARTTYSMDGERWSAVSPPCVMKHRGRK
jgi:hypothetical protein